MIWIPNPTEAWEAVQVVSNDSNSVVVRRLNGGPEFKVPGTLSSFATVSIGAMEDDCDNLVDLETYSEGIILHHVKKRFFQNKIYTFVGNILIALNPYKNIDIYSLAMIERIYNQVKQREETPPHVFSIAANAVFNMREENKNQSILISGESGAGKTEATKKILQFISTVCSSTASRIGPSIEHQILDSNPILESFGNAKTIRNNNSSRFGKYMEVNFDRKHCIKGCRITAYLLEKSRVVKPGPNERNYHVFYMLLAAATKEMRKEFALKPADQFRYLNQGGCTEIPRRDDLAEFQDMSKALDNLCIEPSVQHMLFQCLAAILHLGNVDLVENKEVEDGSCVAVPSDCRRVASLLGLAPDSLERVLCNRDTVINGEALLVPLSPSKAVDQRDSLAKRVYELLFDYLLWKINQSLARTGSVCSIGVLDIFGFEVFQVNSFEQLCINYCNERLQTFFNEVVFHAEMDVYRAEGLPVDDIEYQDNLGCVRLIDLRGAGIFARLDEECTVPKGSEERLVSKLNQVFDENASTRSPFFQRNHKSPRAFSVRHFAGDVHYDATGFLDKNRDALADSLASLLQTSSLSLLAAVPAAALPDGGPGSGPPPSSSGRRAGAGPGAGAKATLSAKFKADLDGLMSAVRGTAPHFVRCIKPNAAQAADVWEAGLALHQLRCSGLFEAIRIRRAGYEVRMPHAVFVRRYGPCLLPVVPPADVRAEPQAHAAFVAHRAFEIMLRDDHLLARRRALEKTAAHRPAGAHTPTPLSPNASETDAAAASGQRLFCVGKSRVFLRTALWKALLDELRALCAGHGVVHMQRLVRGFLVRARLRRTRGAREHAREVEKARRAQEGQAMADEDARARRGEGLLRGDAGLAQRLHAAKVQRAQEERARIAQRRYAACVRIQKVFRGGLYRQRARVFLAERLLENALQSRDETRLLSALQRVAAWRVASKLIAVYRASVKSLILEVMHERYVESQVREALEVQSLDMLRAAVDLARRHGMPYLAALGDARRAVARLAQDRCVLALLGDELSKCTTIPLLLRRHDVVHWLVAEATARGFQHDGRALEAATRLHRVANLLALRQRMRAAVEVCSPTRMKRAQEERKKLLRLFGPDFLLEESTAIDNLNNMLRMQQTLLTDPQSSASGPQSSGEDEPKAAADPRRMTMHEIFAAITHSSRVYHDADDPPEDLLYLPKFVRDPLVRMRHAASHRELTAAMAEYVKLVPQDFHRKFYLRVFKWTVAFAFWMHPDKALDDIRRSIGEADGSLGETDLEAAGTSPGAGGKAAASSPFSPSGTRTVGAHPAASPMRSLPSPRREGSPTRSPSGTFSAYSSSTGRKKQKQQQQTTHKAKTHTPAERARSPSPPPGGSGYIPFSQRQAKSEVAAREMLKKGQNYHFRGYEHRTDSLIQQSLAEIRKFRGQLHGKSTFSG